MEVSCLTLTGETKLTGEWLRCPDIYLRKLSEKTCKLTVCVGDVKLCYCKSHCRPYMRNLLSPRPTKFLPAQSYCEQHNEEVAMTELVNRLKLQPASFWPFIYSRLELLSSHLWPPLFMCYNTNCNGELKTHYVTHCPTAIYSCEFTDVFFTSRVMKFAWNLKLGFKSSISTISVDTLCSFSLLGYFAGQTRGQSSWVEILVIRQANNLSRGAETRLLTHK